MRVLLGPQNPVRTVGEAIDASGIAGGPIAVVSAAWQEAENDLDELRGIVGRELEDLGLYARAETVFHEDSELHAAYRRRQDRLQEQQRLYRVRLRSLALAARHMLRVDGDDELRVAEQRHAIAQLRALDRHHLKRSETLHREFRDSAKPGDRSAIRRQADAMHEILARSAGVLITGGNVAVLINRLRLFDLGEALASRPVVAWSAGAMVLAARIVLFHERMPQGRRDPEVLGAGLSLVPDCVILPDARRRLNPKDRLRTGLTARRFAPDACITLDNEAAAHWRGGRLVRVEGARRLDRSGRFGRLRAA